MKNFTRYPNRVIDDAGITPIELLVYLVIARHADRHGNARLSHETIVKGVACSKSTVIATTAKLKDRALLDFVAGSGKRATSYRLLDFDQGQTGPSNGTAGSTANGQVPGTPRSTANEPPCCSSGTPGESSGTPDEASGTPATPPPALLGGLKTVNKTVNKRDAATSVAAPKGAARRPNQEDQPVGVTVRLAEKPWNDENGFYRGLAVELYGEEPQGGSEGEP